MIQQCTKNIYLCNYEERAHKAHIMLYPTNITSGELYTWDHTTLPVNGIGYLDFLRKESYQDLVFIYGYILQLVPNLCCPLIINFCYNKQSKFKELRNVFAHQVSGLEKVYCELILAQLATSANVKFAIGILRRKSEQRELSHTQIQSFNGGAGEKGRISACVCIITYL